MAGLAAPSERRDGRATDRDDAAERRDDDSRHRDVAADRRDDGALHRDDRSADRVEALRERLDGLRRRAVAGLLRAEEVEIDPADRPELRPAALARLRAHAAEQGHVGVLDDRAVLGLLDDLRGELLSAVEDRAASARDRVSSAGDRHASQRDRTAAAADRVAAAVDRDQAAIEREQADSAGLEAAEPADPAPVVDESVLGRVTRAVQDSRRRIADSRAHLGTTRTDPSGAAPAAGGAELASRTD